MQRIQDVSVFMTGAPARTFSGCGGCVCFRRHKTNAKPLFILAVTFLEIGLFLYHLAVARDIKTGPVFTDSAFIYRPDKRGQVWRFIFYMFVHVEWRHLTFNVVLQLIIGIPLEVVHGFARIGAIYISGVLAGSLATSMFDRDSLLVGASSGVHALIAAHLVNILLNFAEIEFARLKLAAVFVVAIADSVLTVWDRFRLLDSRSRYPTGTVAHVMGAVTGLATSLLCLNSSLHHKPRSRLLWWAALSFCIVSFLTAIIWNFVDYNYYHHIRTRTKHSL